MAKKKPNPFDKFKKKKDTKPAVDPAAILGSVYPPQSAAPAKKKSSGMFGRK